MTRLSNSEFEERLSAICAHLDQQAKQGLFKSSAQFEDAVRAEAVRAYPEYDVDPNPIAQLFPDVPIGHYGIEVKYTESNSWRCIGNSIFEGHRVQEVEDIYIVYAKMGGEPGVRFRLYDDAICHVRTSHVPRFEVSMDEDSPSIFEGMGITYHYFSTLPEEEKMPYVRQYARSRLKEGEHLWWIEDFDGPNERFVPIAARLYTMLDDHEKRCMRAEAALLCPRILNGFRDRLKYGEVALFLLTYHGVAAHQARDLFTAGSASHDGTCPGDPSLNGNYIACSLFDIQQEMKNAANYLPDELFVEYWGHTCPRENRIQEWLKKADFYAESDGKWIPSEHLFLDS